MTIAVCFKCGHIKFGALCKCDKCNVMPLTDYEKALSMVISEPFHSEEKLKEIGKAISKGISVILDKETEMKWVERFRIERERDV